MAVITNLRLTVARTINLGNYENVKIEVSAEVSQTSDKDTSESMQEQLLGEIDDLFDQAKRAHVPPRRRGED